MSNASRTKHVLLALGLVGLFGTLAPTNASAGFHFGGGGGGAHFAAPHFSAPHFSAPHVSAPRFSGGGGRRMGNGGGGRRFAGGDLPHGGNGGFGHGNHGNHGNHGYGGDRHPTHVAHGGSDWSHSRHGRHDAGHDRFACGRHGHCFRGGPTYAGNGPTYYGDGAPDADPVYVGRSESPVPVYSGAPVGPSASVPPVKAPVVSAAPKTCVPSGTFVEVVFQPNVTVTAVTAFLKEYDVTMADGPNPDGVYRIRISSETISPDQIGQMLDAMRSKKDVVSSIQS